MSISARTRRYEQRKKILFICGSLNQTTMMHKIAQELPEHDAFFTPFYCDGVYKAFQSWGWLDFTIIGGQNRENTEAYLKNHRLPQDYAGRSQDYDLVLTCTDLLVQKNARKKPLILVQEGMTDPENALFHIVRYGRHLGMPLWMASTSTTGLSDAYTRFCVASEGYREHFVKKGVKENKVVVTGIPNFDNVREYLQNDFPLRDYVLICTSDTRENFKWDNRKRFLSQAKEIAGNRKVVFKLHPNENEARSTLEIRKYFPDAPIYHRANASHMVANSNALITQYSTLVYIGLALGKEVYSYFELDQLKKLVPLQNNGSSAKNIASVCREYL